MKKFVAALSALALLPGAAHGADNSGPAVFKPSGAWTLDVGDDYCRISRPFSDGSEQITFAMERVQPTNFVRVLLIGNGVKVFRSANQFDYGLLPGSDSRKGPFWRSETADKQQFLSMGEVLMGPLQPIQPPEPGKPPVFPPYSRTAELEFAQGVNALAITGGVTTPLQIDTGGLGGAVNALQKCADDLLVYWKLDAVKHQTMTRAAQPSGLPSDWLPAGTIEFGDFAKLGDSANQVRVMVSAEGKPTGCFIVRPTLDKKANDEICKALMAKGQFLPALDAGGQPMASYWMTAPMMLMPPFRT